MKKIVLAIGIAAFTVVCNPLKINAQLSSKSLLINHGGACGSTSPEEDFFAGTLTSNPSLISNCNIGIPYYNVLAAYNPADHKVYYAYMPGSTTNIYAVDYNFSGSITCPSVPAPTYTYNYPLNQLCFDNNGNNYVFFNFDQTAGTAHLAQVDITTGNQIAGTDKLVQFPSNHIPNSVLFGDMVILSNGRMFTTFGNSPSELFEITNITGSGNATAVYLTDIPRQCFSIGFVDGNLTIAGSDTNGCYYYIWDINSFSLSNAFPFPLGKSSSDMSNLTLAIGSTKQLLGAYSINSNTARLYYQIVVKNKGNIYLNNIQVADDLGKVFGASNVSDINVSFASNPANLQLNTNYNGTTDINLLAPNQLLNNYPSTIDSLIINLSVTVTNLNQGFVYNNSAVTTGNIGSGSNYLAVSDSSNNGDFSKMDLDNNGISDDPGENMPTPFVFGSVLPATVFNLHATKNNDNIQLQWKALADEKVESYEVERSFDGSSFASVGTITTAQNNYSFTENISKTNQTTFYYRIKANKNNANAVYSNTILIKDHSAIAVSASPNPFTNQISIQTVSDKKTNSNIIIRDISGRILTRKTISLEQGNNYFTITDLNKLGAGMYILEIVTDEERTVMKLIKR